MNFTIQLPEGTTNHNDPSLICTPPTWRDMAVFFITNYFIHAATLPTFPGESKREILFSVVNALFNPGLGALRTTRAFLLRPAWRYYRHQKPLECALDAGALCMVVRETSSLSSRMGQYAEEDGWVSRLFKSDLLHATCPRSRRIHGICTLPPTGYELCIVPSGSPLKSVAPSPSSADHIDGVNFGPASEYNVTKILFSLFQVVAGGITIYRTRGDQIAQYGPGAFGLTVVPYVFMSSVNCIAGLLSPAYPSMYLVRTPDMVLAEGEGGVFAGVVAELVVPPSCPVPRDGQRLIVSGYDVWLLVEGRKFWMTAGLGLFMVISPVATVLVLVYGFPGGVESEGGTLDLERFSGDDWSEGTVPATERVWWMSMWTWIWIICGSASGMGLVGMIGQILRRKRRGPKPQAMSSFLLAIPYGVCIVLWVPAIGGMVMVARQLREYGICVSFN